MPKTLGRCKFCDGPVSRCSSGDAACTRCGRPAPEYPRGQPSPSWLRKHPPKKKKS